MLRRLLEFSVLPQDSRRLPRSSQVAKEDGSSRPDCVSTHAKSSTGKTGGFSPSSFADLLVHFSGTKLDADERPARECLRYRMCIKLYRPDRCVSNVQADDD